MFDRLARRRAWLAEALARRRVPLAWVIGVVVFPLARPTVPSVAFGVGVALVGEGIRFWAAGHLNKSREVTSSGPYRWLGHPLYVGSSVMGGGLALASGSVAAAIAIALYLTVTLTAAIRREEAFLRGAFGDRYDRYRHGTATDTAETGRRFSLAQAIANGEHRTVIGLAMAAGLLILKAVFLPGSV